MQYDLDVHSDHSELFLALRDLILSHKEITEIKNAKQTSYKDRYSTICMMRVRHNVVRLSFANGVKMQLMFSELLGEGKIVRYLDFSTIHEIKKAKLDAMMQESLLINMEKYELRKLRCNARQTST